MSRNWGGPPPSYSTPSRVPHSPPRSSSDLNQHTAQPHFVSYPNSIETPRCWGSTKMTPTTVRDGPLPSDCSTAPFPPTSRSSSQSATQSRWSTTATTGSSSRGGSRPTEKDGRQGFGRTTMPTMTQGGSGTWTGTANDDRDARGRERGGGGGGGGGTWISEGRGDEASRRATWTGQAQPQRLQGVEGMRATEGGFGGCQGPASMPSASSSSFARSSQGQGQGPGRSDSRGFQPLGNAEGPPSPSVEGALKSNRGWAPTTGGGGGGQRVGRAGDGPAAFGPLESRMERRPGGFGGSNEGRTDQFGSGGPPRFSAPIATVSPSWPNDPSRSSSRPIDSPSFGGRVADPYQSSGAGPSRQGFARTSDGRAGVGRTEVGFGSFTGVGRGGPGPGRYDGGAQFESGGERGRGFGSSPPGPSRGSFGVGDYGRERFGRQGGAGSGGFGQGETFREAGRYGGFGGGGGGVRREGGAYGSPPAMREKGPFNANLKTVDFGSKSLPAFKRDFYEEHSAISARPLSEVVQWRLDRNVRVDQDAPKPATTWGETKLPLSLLKAYVHEKGWATPTVIQSQAIPMALSGRDLIAISETGSGKTLAYAGPAVVHVRAQPPVEPGQGPIGLVLSPTRELATQILKECQAMSKDDGVKCSLVCGGVSKVNQVVSVRSGVDLLIATPGRLLDLLSTGDVSLERVTYFVLDEADRMIHLGFENEVRQILSMIRPDRQTLMFTATFEPEVREIAKEFYKDAATVTIGMDTLHSCANIEQRAEVIHSMSDKLERLVEVIIKEVAPIEGKALVFVKTKMDAVQVTGFLREYKIEAISLHGDKSQPERDFALSEFRHGSMPVLVATDVAQRGLDIPSISMVINFDCPSDAASYVHRIGRTGRAGAKGIALTVFNRNDAEVAQKIIEVLAANDQTVPSDLAQLAKSQSLFSSSTWSASTVSSSTYDGLNSPSSSVWGARNETGGEETFDKAKGKDKADQGWGSKSWGSGGGRGAEGPVPGAGGGERAPASTPSTLPMNSKVGGSKAREGGASWKPSDEKAGRKGWGTSDAPATGQWSKAQVDKEQRRGGWGRPSSSPSGGTGSVWTVAASDSTGAKGTPLSPTSSPEDDNGRSSTTSTFTDTSPASLVSLSSTSSGSRAPPTRPADANSGHVDPSTSDVTPRPASPSSLDHPNTTRVVEHVGPQASNEYATTLTEDGEVDPSHHDHPKTAGKDLIESDGSHPGDDTAATSEQSRSDSSASTLSSSSPTLPSSTRPMPVARRAKSESCAAEIVERQKEEDGDDARADRIVEGTDTSGRRSWIKGGGSSGANASGQSKTKGEENDKDLDRVLEGLDLSRPGSSALTAISRTFETYEEEEITKGAEDEVQGPNLEHHRLERIGSEHGTGPGGEGGEETIESDEKASEVDS
ncbi:hypothetical protein JCM10212_002010 [Sporobolomyces blumeae]